MKTIMVCRTSIPISSKLIKRQKLVAMRNINERVVGYVKVVSATFGPTFPPLNINTTEASGKGGAKNCEDRSTFGSIP